MNKAPLRNILLLLPLLAALRGWPAPEAPARLSPVWFQHILTPAELAPGQGERLASELRRMLLEGRPDGEILELAPDDRHPRIIFLALGDGEWPERISVDTGETFRQALRNTLTTLRAAERRYPGLVREQQKRLEEQSPEDHGAPSPAWLRKLKDPGRWSSLRLTVVQRSRQYAGFSISLSRIHLTNLNGIAFPREAGFAFPPEQTAGRYLLTPQRFFDSNQIGNILGETGRFQDLGTWLKLVQAAPPFPIILFDCASFFADAAGATRLFRGHPPALDDVSAAHLAALAEACGRRLLAALRKNGGLAPPFPEWIASSPRREHPIALAELSIALSRLHARTGAPEFAAGAARINRGLADLIRGYRVAGRPHRCLVEREVLEDPDDPQEPRRIANTYTNAVAALALLEHAAATGSRDLLPAAEALVLHLANVQRNDGAFQPVFVYPGMRRPAERYFSETGEIELAALACLAMRKYAALAGDAPARPLGRNIRRCLDWIRESCGRRGGLAELPLSPWLAECLAAGAPEDRKPLLLLAGRLAIAAGLDLETDPPLPDLFGSVKGHAGLSLSARRTWLTAAAAEQLLRDGQEDQADVLLSDCWPQLVFQIQAATDPATASPLAQPGRYLGFFRDNLETFSYNLNGQTCQILSLLRLCRTLDAMHRKDLQPSPETRKRWQENWRRIDRSPFLLTPDLVVNNARRPEDVRKISGDIRETPTTTRIQPHGGRMLGTDRTPTGTVLRPSPTPKRHPLTDHPAGG